MQLNWNINNTELDKVLQDPHNRTPDIVLQEIASKIMDKTNNMLYVNVFESSGYDYYGNKQGEVTMSLMIMSRRIGKDASGKLVEVSHQFNKPWPAQFKAWNPARYIDGPLPKLPEKVKDPDELVEAVAQVLNLTVIAHWIALIIQGR